MHIAVFLSLADAEQQAPGALARFIVAWGPFLIALVIFFLFMRRVLSSSKAIRERSLEHMDRIEAKSDEMIALLKEIKDRLHDEGA